MRGITRLIEGLSEGDPTAIAVGIGAVVGTVVIVVITTIVRRRREAAARGGEE